MARSYVENAIICTPKPIADQSRPRAIRFRHELLDIYLNDCSASSEPCLVAPILARIALLLETSSKWRAMPIVRRPLDPMGISVVATEKVFIADCLSPHSPPCWI